MELEYCHGVYDKFRVVDIDDYYVTRNKYVNNYQKEIQKEEIQPKVIEETISNIDVKTLSKKEFRDLEKQKILEEWAELQDIELTW